MFRRKKKEEPTDAPPAPQASESAPAEEAAAPVADSGVTETAAAETASQPATETAETVPASSAPADSVRSGRRGNRVQKVGTVSSDKMQKTVVVRVDRLVLHPKYRRYVRRTSKFMAHDELGATTGDRVRIVETRPLSTRKRWRVVEIVQKAAK